MQKQLEAFMVNKTKAENAVDEAVVYTVTLATFWRKIRGLNLFDSVAARPSSCKNVPKYIHTEIYAFC
jgi:hypothetical protein